jgi:hypothetical protein
MDGSDNLTSIRWAGQWAVAQSLLENWGVNVMILAMDEMRRALRPAERAALRRGQLGQAAV